MAKQIRNIDWNTLRHVRGTKQGGFEELCRALADREGIAGRVRFERNGTPDSGVECYAVRSDGSEVGWQAKCFESPPTSQQWGQVDKSYKKALDGYPQLTHYIVCMATDMPDARLPGKKSMRDQWNERCQKWTKQASQRDRTITFEYWGTSHLVDRLARPKAAGLFQFWFDADELTDEWFSHHVDDQIANAGPRYTKGLTVDVPLFEHINWILRAPQAIKTLQARAEEAVRELYRLVGNVRGKIPGSCEQDLECCANELTQLVLDTPTDPADGLRLGAIRNASQRGSALVDGLHKHALSHESAANWKGRQTSYDRYADHPFKDVLYAAEATGARLRSLAYFAESENVQLAENPFLLITGAAGSGKTHLLCDAAQRQVRAGLPAILLLGDRFSRTAEPWQQIIQMLGLRCASGEDLLNVLSVVAEAKGTRLLFVLDALNEGPGVAYWQTHLSGMRRQFQRHPRIAFLVSVRDPYARVLFGDDFSSWPVHASHDGFADVLEEACEQFFSHYGIDAPNVPTLQAEFANPLFLTLFCQAVKKSGLRQLPEGVDGISQLLTFFVRSLRRKLFGANYALDDPTGVRVSGILDAIADGLKHAQMIPDTEVLERIKSAAPEADALTVMRTLIGEGVLRHTGRYDHKTKTVREGVDFGYERLLHHLVVRSVLTANNSQRGTAGRPPVTRIREFYKSNREDVSRLEALQVELSERFGVELLEVIGKAKWTPEADQAFVQSLASRSASAVTQRAIDAIRKALESGKAMFQYAIALLVDVSYRPGHPLNASLLHEVLWPMSLPDRDEWWSTFIHNEYEWNRGLSPDGLVRWLWRSGSVDSISDESAELAATTVAWFFTTSNRFLRDRATKALVRLLSTRLPIAGTLVQRFNEVNDPYVLERVLAATYGAVLRSTDDSAVQTVAQLVYSVTFKPPVRPHALIRHYAASIVELAISRHGFSGVDQASLFPPFDSTWSEPPPLTDLKALFSGGDATLGQDAHTIVYSVDHHGDFGQYELSASDWTSIPRSESEPPRTREEALDVIDEFVKPLSRFQVAALEDLIRAGEAWAIGKGSHDSVDSAHDRVAKCFRGKRRHTFATRIAPMILELSRFNIIPRFEFPKEVLQRFVLHWIAKVGWTSERFGRFDNLVPNGGRESHKAERIGKKYQWIAYHEGLARISDNFWMRTERSVHEPALTMRHIDPGLLLWAMPTRDGERPDFTWWSPDPAIDLSLDQSATTWIASESDLPDPTKLIALREPESERPLLLLHGDNQIAEERPFGREFSHKDLRRIWWFVDCFLVRKNDWPAVKKWGQKRKADYFHREVGHDLYDVSIGEYPDAPVFHDDHLYYSRRFEWQRENGAPREFVSASDGYTAYDSGYDCSVEAQIQIELPAPCIIDALKLYHRNCDGSWTDASGKLICFDPAVREPGKNALVVDADSFQDGVAKRALVPYWLVRGEKQVLVARDEDWVGHFLYHYFCWFENGKLRHHLSTTLHTRESRRRKRKRWQGSDAHS